MFLASGGKGSGGGGSSGGSNSRSSGGSSSGGGSWFGGGGGKKVDPQESAKEWKRNLQKEMRKIDRDIADIKRQEDRAMKECKALAKKNHASAARTLAKEIVRTRKTVERMYVAKAQLNSVCNSLQTSMCKSACIIFFSYILHFLMLCIALLKLQGCLEKSAEIMTAMNK